MKAMMDKMLKNKYTWVSIKLYETGSESDFLSKGKTRKYTLTRNENWDQKNVEEKFQQEIHVV
jgi:hypothetical protein